MVYFYSSKFILVSIRTLKKIFAKFLSVKESRESGVGYIRHTLPYK